MEKIEIILKNDDNPLEAYNKLIALFDTRDKIDFKIGGEILYELLGFAIFLERKRVDEEFNRSFEEVLKGLRKDNKA